MTDKFVAPPFNYCDYRCERCDKTGGCKVYQKEYANRLRHILEGEDPDDMHVVVEDMKNIFAETKTMLCETAKERGLDLNAIDCKEGAKELAAAEKAAKNHVLFKKAMSFMKRGGAFLKKCEKKLVITPEIRPFFDEIEWNRTLIAAKTFRALACRTDDEFDREDNLRTAELILSCLEKCRGAIKQIIYYRPEGKTLADPIQKLLEDMQHRWEKQISSFKISK